MIPDRKAEVPSWLETERLLLRCPKPGDAQAIYTAISESLPELRPWMRWAAEPPDLEKIAGHMHAAEVDFRQGKNYRFQVMLKGTGILVGACGLHEPDWSVPSFEIGYWLRTAYTGQGYMHEAVVGLSTMVFEKLGAHRIQITCNANNTRSAAVARKAGFELEGIRRNAARDHLSGELYDEMVFSRIR